MPRRKPREQVPTVKLPSVLMRNGIDLVPLLPVEWKSHPLSFDTVFAARQLRDVARARFLEITGCGFACWRYPPNVPAPIRKAGEKLAEELARQ